MKRPFQLGRLSGALLGAGCGAVVGYLYAHFNLPPELLAEGRLGPMWVSAGAAAGVLTLRMLSLTIAVFRDGR